MRPSCAACMLAPAPCIPAVSGKLFPLKFNFDFHSYGHEKYILHKKFYGNDYEKDVEEDEEKDEEYDDCDEEDNDDCKEKVFYRICYLKKNHKRVSGVCPLHKSAHATAGLTPLGSPACLLHQLLKCVLCVSYPSPEYMTSTTMVLRTGRNRSASRHGIAGLLVHHVNNM